jgi:hypothetical protein
MRSGQMFGKLYVWQLVWPGVWGLLKKPYVPAGPAFVEDELETYRFPITTRTGRMPSGHTSPSPGQNPTERIWRVLSTRPQVQVIPKKMRLQAYFEHPVYQHFNGVQLGSDYNFRLSVAYVLPLGRGDEH